MPGKLSDDMLVAMAVRNFHAREYLHLRGRCADKRVGNHPAMAGNPGWVCVMQIDLARRLISGGRQLPLPLDDCESVLRRGLNMSLSAHWFSNLNIMTVVKEFQRIM